MHRRDEGRDRLRKFVRRVPPKGPLLPLIHSTDAYALGNITDDGGTINPQTCPVFDSERLTYFFYGKAAYRPNITEDPTTLDHYFPVCLILKLDVSIRIKRIFPFDSGAFTRDFYNSYLHKKMQIGDFSLDPSSDTPGRLISRFYTDNTNYVLGEVVVSEPIDPSEFEAKSLEALLTSRGSNAVDSRGSGIEVQTDQAIDLARDVEAAIIPSSQARSRIGKTLREAGIEVIPYRTLGRMRPNEFTGNIYDKCLDYLCRKELIDEDRI